MKGVVTRPFRYQYVRLAVPAGMSTVWDRLAVWLADDEAPNRAQPLPVRGGEVELVVEQDDGRHRGDPSVESASVQLGLLGFGSPVASSKPPSWMSSAAAAGQVKNGATTSAHATRSALHAAEIPLNPDMFLVPPLDR